MSRMSRFVPPARSRLLALLLALTAVGVHPDARAASGSDAGSKGAQVYCFMRTEGNGHEVSWNAAYALIKRQGGGIFKTSPAHAAVMITEAVVNDPSGYPECGRYLGALFGGEKGNLDAALDGASHSSPSGAELDHWYTY